jgi:hypothetical protein
MTCVPRSSFPPALIAGAGRGLPGLDPRGHVPAGTPGVHVLAARLPLEAARRRVEVPGQGERLRDRPLQTSRMDDDGRCDQGPNRVPFLPMLRCNTEAVALTVSPFPRWCSRRSTR